MSRWVRRYGVVKKSPTAVAKKHYAIEQPEANRRHDEHVRSVQEGCPALARSSGRLTMYMATVDWATSMPSLSNSPWIRGAPHNQLSRLICGIRSRISCGIAGRPPRGRDFQRQKALNPRRCQRTKVSGLMIATVSTTLGQKR